MHNVSKERTIKEQRIDKYDVVVIGAGAMGLSSALTLSAKGLRVLLVDQRNKVGGRAGTIRYGKYEFERTLSAGTFSYKELQPYLDKYNVDVKWLNCSSAFHVYFASSPERDYRLGFGLRAFFTSIGLAFPEHKEGIEILYGYFDSVYKAVEGIKNKVPMKRIKKENPFLAVLSSKTLLEVEKQLCLPQGAIEIINALWVETMTTPDKLSFVIYAYLFSAYMEKGGVIPTTNSQDILNRMYIRTLSGGVNIWLNSKVDKIVKDGNKVVVHIRNKRIYVDRVVFGSYAKNVSGIISECKQDFHVRKASSLQSNGMVNVYIGLKVPYKKAFIRDYYSVVYSFDDYDLSLPYAAIVGVCPDFEKKRKDSCCIRLSAVVDKDILRSLNRENYNIKKYEFARQIIENYERATGTKLLDDAEVIEVETSLALRGLTSSKEGDSLVSDCSVQSSFRFYSHAAIKKILFPEENSINDIDFASKLLCGFQSPVEVIDE